MVPVFTYSPPSPATSTHQYLELVNTGTVTPYNLQFGK